MAMCVIPCVAGTPSGGVRCWGYNAGGNLGVNFTTSSPVYGLTAPLATDAITGVSHVAVGVYTVCVLIQLTAGVRCWGSNTHGSC